MAHYVKPGFWDSNRKVPKEGLNLDLLVKSVVNNNSTETVQSGASITLSSNTGSLTTSESAITVNITAKGDITLRVILNTTSSTLSFPAGSLCVADGIASGNNTCTLIGTSGDTFIIGIKEIDGVYYVVSKNFEQ